MGCMKQFHKFYRELIINLTIPEFPQPQTPEEQIERRGYERARGMYAEAKLATIKSIPNLLKDL